MTPDGSRADETLALRRYGPSAGSHSHTHFQVLVGLSGALELELDGRGLRVAPGQGCVIAPGTRHDFEARGGSLCLVLDTDDPRWATGVTHGPVPAPVRALADYLAQMLPHQRPLARAWGASLLREAWQLPGIPHWGVSTPTAPRRLIDWDALRVWALQHLHAPLTVADLAARVHLSASQFASRCQQEQGCSAMAWLRQLRLDQARLLRAQGLAVAETARRTGYRSPSALTAALRRDARTPGGH